MKRDNSEPKTYLNRKTLILGLLVLILAGWVVSRLVPRPQQLATISLSKAAEEIAAGKVTQIQEDLSTNEFLVHFQDGSIEKGVQDPSSPLLEQFSLLGLTSGQLAQVQFEVTRGSSPAGSGPLGIVLGCLLLGGVGYAAYRYREDRFGNKTFEVAGIPDVRFEDVAGLDENLEELRDVVTFLKEGNRYAEIGAKMPRGVLMVGDPGTGKTLIAKAVAGEAGVPFYATSGSEFTEVFVGVGASRIRSLFRKARKKAPCIIFIDEIDAVGRERHRTESGAEMEQDQTLNQLLVEMDGFSSSEGIIVLAATNRLDVLDPALTRPGRFDRQVYVYRPDVKGRQAILGIHVQGKRLAPDVQLANLAKATPGLVGADLANVVNEAAIIAVRGGRTEIHMRDFEDAIEKMIAGGVQRTNYVMSEDERKIVAYHEAGHAVVMHSTRLSDPVYKITIIPRGQAGGYTMSLPEDDQMLMSRAKILARITGLLGGRAAEEIFFQDITSGASNDLNVATHLAEEMVMRLGMDTRTGLRVFPQLEGRAAFMIPQGSQKTYEIIDESVKDILDECYNEARRILLEKRLTVEIIAGQLLEVETLDRDHFVQLVESAQKIN